MAVRPGAKSGPSGLLVVLAFGIAVAAAGALIAVALLLRDDDGARAPVTTPLVDLGGIPQSGTTLGAPDARLTLIEYADLQCPFCRAYSEDVFPSVVDEYVRDGRVKTEFRGLAFIGSDSEKALRFVLAAGLQDRLWQLEEALYRNQGRENSGWVTDELVRELASGIPGLGPERLFADAEGSEVTALMDRAASEAQAAQVRGTPTFFVQIGEKAPYYVQLPLEPEAFRAALDDALAG